MARCSSCQAEIIWARSVRGVSMPLDKIPVLGGNVDLDDVLIARVVGSDMKVRRFVAHFASCKNAASHRSKARA